MDSPVGFAQVLEIVHVAAGGGVLCVQSLPLLGVRDLDQVPMVLHHELAPGELLGSDHAPAFAIDEVNLLGGDETEKVGSSQPHVTTRGQLRVPGAAPLT